MPYHYKSLWNAHFAEKYWKSASSSFRTTFSFPPLPSCLVNHADISWFWQIWHIYEAGYLSAQQEQKSVSFISLANADRWCSCTIFWRDLQDIPDLQYFAVGRVAIYILSLVICSIIQHWWLILIVGGWLIVAMLQYVMAAHTDPSPAATSSAAPSHLILLFLHSHILVLNMKANRVLFFSLQFHWFWKQKKPTTTTNKQSRERWTGGDSQQRLLCPST